MVREQKQQIGGKTSYERDGGTVAEGFVSEMAERETLGWNI